MKYDCENINRTMDFYFGFCTALSWVTVLVAMALAVQPLFELSHPASVMTAIDYKHGIPYAGTGEYDRQSHIKFRAKLKLACILVLYFLMQAYVSQYKATHMALVAERNNAEMSDPPYLCNGNTAWSLSVSMTSEEELQRQCSEFNRKLSMDVWPNPLMVLFETFLATPAKYIRDSMADSIAQFIKRIKAPFNLMSQAYMMLTLPVCLLVCAVFAIGWAATAFVHIHKEKSKPLVPVAPTYDWQVWSHSRIGLDDSPLCQLMPDETSQRLLTGSVDL